jgi:hypothetical protein
MPKSLRSRLLARISLCASLSLFALPAFAGLSLLDARVVEGNAGRSSMVFEARLSAPAAGPVSFNFATADGTATSANADYFAQNLVGVLSIPAGQTSLLIYVPVQGDGDIEANEYVVGSLSNVVGATVDRGTAFGLIANDDDKMLVTAPHLPHEQANGSAGTASDTSAMSSDGRFVAFVSDGNDLVAVWPNTIVKRVYVRDNRTGLTTLASVAANGGDSNGQSVNPALSDDGRYVVFESLADNLVPGDNNLKTDVFRRDLLTGTTELVSVNSAGTGPGNGFSTSPSISADGRYVAFDSSASDLGAGDTNFASDVFVRDMQTGALVLASDGSLQGSFTPKLSADGRYVAYNRDFVPWRRDLQTGTQSRMANGFGGLGPNDSCFVSGISSDGRYVLFVSSATNLVADGGGSYGTYVTDAQTLTTVLASRGSNGVRLSNSASPSISGDGRYVVFQSLNTAAGEPLDDGTRDIYLRDLQANTTTRISQNYLGGLHSGGDNFFPAISRDGRVVSFLSNSPTMLPGDNNNKPDVYRVELPGDASLPALSISDAVVSEGDAGTTELNFVVMVPAPVSVPVVFDFDTADGSAVAGSDYEARHLVAASIPVGQYSTVVTIPVDGDTLLEAEEAFNVYLSHVSGARLVDGHALVRIADNDFPPPTPSLSIGDVSISEGNTGTTLANFTVTLSSTSANAVSFNVATANGSATAGSDYVALSQTGVQIPAGSTSQVVSVVINGDGVVEANETFYVLVSNVVGATVADNQGIGTITNDDAYPTLSIADVSVTEGNSGTQLATFTVQLSAPAASQVVYNIATANVTADGNDYDPRALSSQIIPVGASSASFAVTVKGDLVVEGNDTFQVNVSNVSGATVVDGQAIGTILNDDVPPSLSVADVSVTEGNSGTRVASFTLQLSAPAASPVFYNVATADGTAVAPGDYVASSGSGQFPIGASAVIVNVTVNGDTAIEPTETFLLNVSGVSGATVADGQAVGTIVNDDFLPTLSIADLSIAEGNNGSKLATFTVSLSAASGSAVGFTAATANGTAVAPGDYTAMAPTSLAISPGALSKTFTVSIKGDKTVEPNETFYVNLSNPTSNATIADGQAVATIVNDDATKLTLARVTTGGLYDDVDDHRGDPVLAPREYALLLLDAAQQVCARGGGATIVGIDGVENLSVLSDLADTASHTCARQPQYSAVLKANGLGFLVDGRAGVRILDVAALGPKAQASALTVQGEGEDRALTVLLTNAAPAADIDRAVQARLAAEPRARIVLLGNAAGAAGLADLSARLLPAGKLGSERVWVSAAVLEEFEGLRLDLPAPAAKPAQQVLQLRR